MSLPRAPIPNSNLTSWLNRFRGECQRFTVGNSDSITIQNTPQGTIFEINDNVIPRTNPVGWASEYIDDHGYSIGTLVYVKDQSEYSGSLGTFQSYPGVYICVSPVPPFVDTDAFTGTDYSSYLQSYYAGLNQVDNVIYAPVYPYPSDTPAYQTTGSDGKYWHLIGLAPQLVQQCGVDETLTDYYTQMVQSGSNDGG